MSDSAERPVLPDWLPVLRRGPGEIQIGLDPDAGLILSGVPDGLVEVLRLLDGAHAMPELIAAAADQQITPDLLQRVLRDLGAAGLLRARPTTGAEPLAGDDPGRLRIRLLGAGALGQAVATALVDAGVGWLHLVDADPVDPHRYPRAGLATTQAQALAGSLGGDPDDPARVTRVRTAEHWSKPESPPPDLTVIAVDRAEPDRAIGADYVRENHPHLYLRPSLGGAVIGPYVRPGRSACLACSDLIRADADPAWPVLLRQLCRTPLTVDPLLAAWAGTTAATQLLAELSGRSGTPSGTLETTAGDCQMRFRSWPMHPSCGCAWQV